ncbi:hypothetical protein [Marinomonas sp. 2405UD68-3]|uniref:hypothetical protein n=1 Tax=Marinomonas sp. 2405UD68-3 TaxID=3391835 RepID=UPI0039C9CDFA
MEIIKLITLCSLLLLTACGGGSDSTEDSTDYVLDQFLLSTYDEFELSKDIFESTEDYYARIDEKRDSVRDTSLTLYGSALGTQYRRLSFNYNADTNTGIISINFSRRSQYSYNWTPEPSFTGISYILLKTKTRSDKENGRPDEEVDNPYIITPLATDYGRLESTHEYVFDNISSVSDIRLTENDDGYCEDTLSSFKCTIVFFAEPEEAQSILLEAQLDITINELLREREWNYTKPTSSEERYYTYEWYYPASFKELTIKDKFTGRLFGKIAIK